MRKLFYVAIILAVCVMYYRSILVKAQNYVDQNPQAEWAPKWQYYIGDVYFFASDYADAEKAYLQVKKKFPKSFYASRAQFSIGRIYEEQENYQRAKAEYEKFVKDYPFDSFARRAKDKLDVLALFKNENKP